MEEINKVVEPKESILNSGLNLKNAKVEINHDLVIYGNFIGGEICSSAKVTIADGATVKSAIKCATLAVYGNFDGKAEVKGNAAFYNGSILNGAFTVGNFSAEAGAILHATIAVTDKPKPAAPVKK